MDPHANVVEAVSLAHEIVAAGHANADDLEENVPSSHLHLAELVIALHDWRMKGGFDPYLPPDAPVADPQANALLERVKTNKGSSVFCEPFDLPPGYVLVVEMKAPSFTCGIAPDGSVSS